MNDLVLVTGGTGKTGKALMAQLHEKGIACRATSRNGTPPFDWAQPATWDAALEGVTAVYLVAPSSVSDPFTRMIAFLEVAKQKGVGRFVLLSMAFLPAGGPGHGLVHAWLRDNTADWAVLGPTAFMQNFSEGPYLATICNEDTIYSNTGAGRLSFIDANDIAAAAIAVLMAPEAQNRDFVLTGSETISYDRVAEIISEACGRKISHTQISTDDMATRFMAERGIPEETAKLLAAGYETIATGLADWTTDVVETLTSKPPRAFEDFAKAHAGVWKPGPMDSQ
ncbi:MAG: NAD(P)H-binding protein [Parvibaculaceae bacterium]